MSIIEKINGAREKLNNLLNPLEINEDLSIKVNATQLFLSRIIITTGGRETRISSKEVRIEFEEVEPLIKALQKLIQ